MTESKRVCAWRECDVEFTPVYPNQIYHSSYCSAREHNARGIDKYHSKKKRLAGSKRICQTEGCETILSRYNPSKICAKCISAEEASATEKFVKEMEELGWGFLDN